MSLLKITNSSCGSFRTLVGMSEFRKNLFLLDPLYGLVAEGRNLLFDWGVLSSWKSDIPSICVGNLSVGGTGKTPHIEYLIELLQKDWNPVVLSRGYGRSSTGLVHSGQNKSSEWLGDEPAQIHFKYPDIPVVCSSDRREGFEYIRKHALGNLVLMDDGFQHRSVRAKLNILLTAHERPFWHDHYLPSGDLREGIRNQKRADAVVVTKCREFPKKEEQDSIARRLRRKKVHFSQFQYELPDSIDAQKKYLLITGLAYPEPLHQELRNRGISFEHMEYRDHHNFNKQDLETWNHLLRTLDGMLTTEKDLERMRAFLPGLRGSLDTIAVKVKFADPEFDKWLLNETAKWKRV